MNLFFLLLTGIICFIIFRYFIYPLYYYRQVDKLPGEPRHPIYGTLNKIPKDQSKVIDYMLELGQKYGPVRRNWIGPAICSVTIESPKDLKILFNSHTNIKKAWTYQVVEAWLGYSLLTSTGDFWKQQRKLLTPAFHYTHLEGYVPITIQHALNFCKNLEGKTDTAINICPLISALTLDIIGLCAFGVNLHAQSDDKSHRYVQSIMELGNLFIYRMRHPWLFNDHVFSWTAKGKEWVQCLKELHQFTNSVIQTRKNEKVNERPFRDFLDILIESKLSDEQMRAEVDTFMFEGHDTTAHGIIWCLYNLAKHPQIQQKLQEEVDQFFSQKGELNHHDLKKMEYLNLVLDESHRLHPPVPFIARELVEDMQLSSGDVLPAGTWLQVNIISVHRNPALYPNPNEFIPGREKPNEHFAYVPFSAGARNCIGQQFAMNEERLIISYILRHFTLSLASDKEPKMVGRFVLSLEDEYDPAGGIQLKFHKRNLN